MIVSFFHKERKREKKREIKHAVKNITFEIARFFLTITVSLFFSLKAKKKKIIYNREIFLKVYKRS